MIDSKLVPIGKNKSIPECWEKALIEDVCVNIEKSIGKKIKRPEHLGLGDCVVGEFLELK